MRHLKIISKVSLTMLFCCGLMVPLAHAKRTTTLDETNTTTLTNSTAPADGTAAADSQTAVQMVRRIVLFKAQVSQEERLQYVQDWSAYGVTLLMDLPFINGLVLSVPETIAPADLAADNRVAGVEEGNQKVSLQAVSAAADGGAADGGAADGGAADGGATNFITPVGKPAKWHRPWGICKLNDAPYDPYAYTYLFEYWIDEPPIITEAILRLQYGDTKVAIFDSGVDDTHPNLKGVVKGGIDLTGQVSGYQQDDNGHGTHVIGTLSGYVAGYFGLAPWTKVYVVKVLDQNAIGDVSSLIMGLQWAIDNGIDVINMSVAYSAGNPALHLAIQKAYEAGIVIVAAVGNHSNWDLPAPSASADGGAADGGAADGGAADGGAADGGAADSGTSLASTYSVMYPAKYPEVIGVGASDSFGDLASFSNTGPEMDLTAPGTNVVSIAPGRGFGICSGTSMAVPHVTSAAAMMLALDPQLTPEQVKSILKETAVNGELNLVGALTLVKQRKGQ